MNMLRGEMSICQPMLHVVVYCRENKRHDNFTDIGICPKTGIRPHKLELADVIQDVVDGDTLVFVSPL